ncbi:FAD-dependent oxidoreductase [Streptomyces sp. NPDC001941]|uniref:GMC family oxidoreductase n=1 Tax=Streptomyces sp. NPDC001941 TaxID=3154659 RepID=UPI003322EDC4
MANGRQGRGPAGGGRRGTARTTSGPGFDYVIVGAGSAGCVLAARLSEDPAVRVALVESGGRDPRPGSRIPAAFPRLFRTRHDWDFATTAQPALDGRPLYWPRGHMLGGCSSMNAMMWLRGHRDDYDAWGALAGGEWGYEALLPYFRRAEEALEPRAATREPNPATRAFLDACREAGIGEAEPNGPDHSGAAFAPVNQRDGRRWSVVDAYLRPALRRPNLTLVTGVRVRGVAFEGTRATGVLADRGLLRARREVLLCAGAIGTPHLLMHSGIGDPEVLRAARVPVRVEAPGVGRGLRDHLSYAVTVRCPRPVTLTGADTVVNLARAVAAGRGPLTSNVGEAVAFVRSSPGLAAPDLELVFAPVPFVNHGLEPPAEHGITVGAVLLQPESEGRITIENANPLDRPRIDPAYLSAPADLPRLLAGVRRAEALLATDALAPYVSGPLAPYPGPGLTDEALAEAVRGSAETLYHPVGTCAMGLAEGAPVDPSLRVRGTEGLRVVDASVLPAQTRGHTQAAVVAVAERGVGVVRGDRSLGASVRGR